MGKTATLHITGSLKGEIHLSGYELSNIRDTYKHHYLHNSVVITDP
jgi:hypothetical protein